MKYRKLKDAVANFKIMENNPNLFLPTPHAHIKGVICPINLNFLPIPAREGEEYAKDVDFEKLSSEYLDVEKDYDIYADEDDKIYIKKDDEYILTVISVKDLPRFNNYTPEFE